ncbi:MAG: hypothetical protein JNK67_18150 [Alphaproteobacteria bacterium]|nr:hypothetical protein [Alphaproteobacteria bacterium]
MPSPASPSPVVYVVHADRGFLELVHAAAAQGGLTVVDIHRIEALAPAIIPTRRGCVLVDAGMAGARIGDVIAELRGHGATLPVITVAAHGDVAAAVEAIRGGAHDVVELGLDQESLLMVMRRGVAADRGPMPRHPDAHDFRRDLDGLTEREREVFDRMILGQQNKIVAHALGISTRTVEIHRSRILRKFGMTRVIELTIAAARAGLLDMPYAVPRAAAVHGR